MLPCSAARFSNFQILSCPPTISSLNKFIDMVARFSLLPFFKGGGGNLLLGLVLWFRLGLGLGLTLGLSLGFSLAFSLGLGFVYG